MRPIWRYLAGAVLLVVPSLAAIVVVMYQSGSEPSEDVGVGVAFLEADAEGAGSAALEGTVEGGARDTEPDVATSNHLDDPSIVMPRRPVSNMQPGADRKSDRSARADAPNQNGTVLGGGGGSTLVRSPKTLRREGTQVVDLVGEIGKVGTQSAIVPSDGSPPLFLLENQMLERIEQYESISPTERSCIWRVAGRVTEYRGSNYLFVTGATIADDPGAR